MRNSIRWPALFLVGGFGMPLLAAAAAAPLVVREGGAHEDAPKREETGRPRAREDSFKPLRLLLIRANVPFDPDLLLRADWPERLSPVLDSMPEMRRTVELSGPEVPGGAIIAGVIVIKGDVHFCGDTVLLARKIVFDSASPVVSSSGESLGIYPLALEHTDPSFPRNQFRIVEIGGSASDSRCATPE